MKPRQMLARQYLANVAEQLNGCAKTNSRRDQTPFECRLTHDRAVDMMIRTADVYFEFLSDEATLRQMRSGQAKMRAIRIVEMTLNNLRRKGITPLPDVEDIDEAIRGRSKSIHEAYPTSSTQSEAAAAHRMAVELFRAVEKSIIG